MPSFRHSYCQTALLMLLAFTVGPLDAASFDLSAAQRARLEKYLPHSLAKLLKKEPVKALLVGDNVMAMSTPTDDDGNTLKSYAGVFLNQLADQFYYPGGLRVLRPGLGKKEKALEISGAEISVRNISRSGKFMIHGMNVLGAAGWEEEPDLVIVSFGINDAMAQFSLARYRQAVQDVVDSVKAHHVDLILLGPTLTLTDPPERGLALTRPYADTMREVAQAAGVFFADLGDIAWLVQVDERMKDLERPAPKKADGKPDASADSKALPEGRPPGVITDFPKWEELDPDPEKRAARLFHEVSSYMHGWYDHNGTMDLMHPNTKLHRVLGRRVFAELLNGPRILPWSIGPAIAVWQNPNTVDVSFRVENTGKEPLRVNALPLVPNNWKPQFADTQAEMLPGRKGIIKITYTREGTGKNALPAHEPLLRLPVMLIGNGAARIEDLHAKLAPFTVLWKLGSQFNADHEFTLSGEIMNSSTVPLSGEWSAECLGQKLAGQFTAPANTSAPVLLKFKLPADGSAAARRASPVKFSVSAGELKLDFDREVELVQNLGLKQAVALHGDSAERPAGHGITFRADADANALYFTYDVTGLNLVDDGRGLAIQGEVNVDGRSFGKRLTHGVTDAVRFNSAAADGPAAVLIQPWAFGTGYGEGRFNIKAAQATLVSRPDGSRRLTVMLPREFFKLHEWALGNGNSILGISSSVTIWQRPDDKNPSGSNATFTMLSNGMHRDDAEALGVLELTAQPTTRWTVHFY